MADADAVADDGREAMIGVHDGAVLDVGVLADFNRFGVAAYNRERPYRSSLVQRHVSTNERERMNDGHDPTVDVGRGSWDVGETLKGRSNRSLGRLGLSSQRSKI